MYVKTTTIVGTNITAVQCKMSASQDGVVYEDVYSLRDGATEQVVGHNFAISAAGTPQENTFTIHGSFQYLKVSAQSVGGAGQAGESVIVTAQPY
jgi:hypothetical protein